MSVAKMSNKTDSKESMSEPERQNEWRVTEHMIGQKDKDKSTCIRKKKIERQSEHRDLYCDYMQLFYIDSNLKKLSAELIEKRKDTLQRQEDIKRAKDQFGRFLKQIHDLTQFRNIEKKRTEYRIEKEKAFIECNQLQGLLEIEIKEYEKERERLRKYRDFIKDVIDETPAAKGMTVNEFLSNKKFAVKAVSEILENYEYRQVSQLALFDQEESENKRIEAALDKELTELEKDKEKIQSNLLADTNTYGEFSHKRQILSEYLSEVKQLSTVQVAQLNDEHVKLSAKILEIYREVFPDAQADDISSMEQMKAIEKCIFDILDKIEQSPKEETKLLMERNAKMRLRQMDKEALALEKIEKHKKHEIHMARAFKPVYKKPPGKPIMFRSRLSQKKSSDIDIFKRRDVELFGVTDKDTNYQNFAKQNTYPHLSRRRLNNGDEAAAKNELLLVDSATSLTSALSFGTDL